MKNPKNGTKNGEQKIMFALFKFSVSSLKFRGLFFSFLFCLCWLFVFVCIHRDRKSDNYSNWALSTDIICRIGIFWYDQHFISYITAVLLLLNRAIFMNESTTVDELFMCQFIVINTWKTNSNVFFFFHWTKNFFIFHWILFFVSSPNSTKSLINFLLNHVERGDSPSVSFIQRVRFLKYKSFQLLLVLSLLYPWKKCSSFQNSFIVFSSHIFFFFEIFSEH